ncbi:zinc finger, CCHC-type containing protein [Tanacetum coccineum]
MELRIFSLQKKNKLMPRVEGPFKMLERFGYSAYKVELLGDVSISIMFNVGDLTPYLEDDYLKDLRSSPNLEGEDDAGVSEVSVLPNEPHKSLMDSNEAMVILPAMSHFEGVLKKMHFMLSCMSVVYVLTTPMPEDGGDDATMEQIRKRAKWDNDDYVCRGLILNGKSDSLFIVYHNDGDVVWWVDSGATVHMCKDRCWLNIGSAFMSTSKLNDSILWHARLGHVHFKRMKDMLKDGLIPAFDMDTKKCNKKYFVTFIDDASRFCYVYLLHSKDEALDKFKVFKTEVELQQGSQIKRFWTDRVGEYMDTLYFQSVGIIHETTAPYTPQQNVVRLPDPKLKTLGERGIKCIFVGYAKHSKAFRFYVIEPNDSVLINSIIESRDVIFDENRFSSVPRPSLRIPNGTEDIGGSVVPEEVTEEVVQQPEPELRKSKRNRTPKDFGPEFQLYLIEGTRDEVSDQHSYCFNVEDDPKTFDEAMKSQDVAFWKEAINDEMDSIMGNNT